MNDSDNNKSSDENHDEEYEDEEEENEEYNSKPINTMTTEENTVNFGKQLIDNIAISNSLDSGYVIGSGFNLEQNNNPNFNNSENIIKLIFNFMSIKGWSLFNKNGEYINNFTSLELFEYLTINILGNNILLDNFKITSEYGKKSFLAGNFYIYLMKIIPLIIHKKKEPYFRGCYNIYNINNNLNNEIIFPDMNNYNLNNTNNFNYNNQNLYNSNIENLINNFNPIEFGFIVNNIGNSNQNYFNQLNNNFNNFNNDNNKNNFKHNLDINKDLIINNNNNNFNMIKSNNNLKLNNLNLSCDEKEESKINNPNINNSNNSNNNIFYNNNNNNNNNQNQ